MSDFTKNKIFNMALKNLGVSTGVQNSNQNERNIVVLNEFYDVALQKTLIDHDWSFASSYRKLALTGNIPDNPEFLYEYDYPQKCLKVRSIFSYSIPKIDNIDKEQTLFQIGADDRGRRIIYANVDNAVIRYTKLIENPAFYPPDFILALSWHLAYLASTSIINTRAKTSDCLQLYKQSIREAQVADANEQNLDDEFICDWLEARN